MSKLVASIKEAIEKCELRDGMTISFHHHMRNGDYVLNMVLDEIAKMGIKYSAEKPDGRGCSHRILQFFEQYICKEIVDVF